MRGLAEHELRHHHRHRHRLRADANFVVGKNYMSVGKKVVSNECLTSQKLNFRTKEYRQDLVSQSSQCTEVWDVISTKDIDSVSTKLKACSLGTRQLLGVTSVLEVSKLETLSGQCNIDLVYKQLHKYNTFLESLGYSEYSRRTDILAALFNFCFGRNESLRFLLQGQAKKDGNLSAEKAIRRWQTDFTRFTQSIESSPFVSSRRSCSRQVLSKRPSRNGYVGSWFMPQAS